MNHIEERIGEVGIKADDIEHVGGTVCIECDVSHGPVKGWSGWGHDNRPRCSTN